MEQRDLLYLWMVLRLSYARPKRPNGMNGQLSIPGMDGIQGSPGSLRPTGPPGFPGNAGSPGMPGLPDQLRKVPVQVGAPEPVSLAGPLLIPTIMPCGISCKEIFS